MENGGFNEKFGGLSINDAKDNNLFQVMKAVEAAESTIRYQADEMNRMRAELRKKDQELENLKVVKSVAQMYYSGSPSDERRPGVDRISQKASVNEPPGTLMLQHALTPNAHFHEDGHSGESRSNGNLNTRSGSQTPENVSFSQLSSPTSYSPQRYPKDGEHDHRINSVQGLLPVAESDSQSTLWKQIKEREEEILQLRKHLTEFSIKESQIRNEKYVLEKRIAHMRMAFDQQQQDLVDATSKALSYRQDIIEENVRLTYALQYAQQERTTFISSLLPLLGEYSLQPQVSDAQSIVSNIKILFKHLQEKLIITEAKLKESQYQLTSWRSDGMGPDFVPQSPEHSSGAALTSSKIGLELVPRPTYSPANVGKSDSQGAMDWDSRGQHALQVGVSGPSAHNAELDNIGKYSPLASSDSHAHEASAQVVVSHDEYATPNRQVKFKDPVSSSEVYGADSEGHHFEREHTGTWGPGISNHSNTVEDPSSSYSPYLQPVPEEPSSSFSEAADDDPLPAIEDLQISGEPYPGRQLQACGFSVNGTTSCNFEWVRHLEDGSVKYIDGAKQPIYLVTADDVETYLVIEVQPLDDRKRKGEVVRVFANDHKKITCDPATQVHIEQNLRNGHASYKVSVSTGYLDIWEPATLVIKREGYSIKGSASSGIAISEKFSPGTTVTITYGQVFEFAISNPSGSEHILRADETIEDIISVRDTVVLTLRLFIRKAMQKGKGKKRRIFFK